MTSQPPAATSAAVKCACASCHCTVTAAAAKAINRDGRLYCGATCAYDCTPTTCLCVHDACDDHPPGRPDARQPGDAH